MIKVMDTHIVEVLFRLKNTSELKLLKLQI